MLNAPTSGGQAARRKRKQPDLNAEEWEVGVEEMEGREGRQLRARSGGTGAGAVAGRQKTREKRTKGGGCRNQG